MHMTLFDPGGFVALRQALQRLVDRKAIDALPLNGTIAAVSPKARPFTTR